ncbi:hypothetical protein BD408DRAFT_410559 [Parasitella parasitica]|nr:hypothetical protein BD408DRAFT_410559 [Parasitella parasitica]
MNQFLVHIFIPLKTICLASVINVASFVLTSKLNNFQRLGISNEPMFDLGYRSKRTKAEYEMTKK